MALNMKAIWERYGSQVPSDYSGEQAIKDIGYIYQFDKDYAKKAIKELSTSPQNPFFTPYSTPTNKSVSNLAAYGVDTSKIDDDFYAKNDYLRQYLQYNGTTNSPSKPGKKASLEEKAAYEYWQVYKSEEDTRKAEQQWNDLQNDIRYWAQRADRNLSDEQVLAKIDWSKYDALLEMDNPAFNPKEYNRAIGYSKAAMYGVLWAARNGGGSGDALLDFAQGVAGIGNFWRENKDISAKLDVGNKNTYSPYSVGCTMDKEAQYFGVDHFDQKWIDENAGAILTGNDDKAKEYLYNVMDAVEYTEKLKSEREMMTKDIDELLKYYDSPEDVIEAIKTLTDENGSLVYKDLFDLDETITGNRRGKLKNVASAVDYRWADIEKIIRDKCAEKTTTNAVDFLKNIVAGITAVVTSQAVKEATPKPEPKPEPKVPKAQPTLPPVTTKPEKTPGPPKNTPKPKETPGPEETSAAPKETPAPKDTTDLSASPTPEEEGNQHTISGEDIPTPVVEGTIDINNRDVVVNDDGSISTERSMSFYDEDTGYEVLVPTVIDGEVVSEQEAKDHYYATGEHLGMFKTPEDATKYAIALSNRQSEYYNQQKPDEAEATEESVSDTLTGRPTEKPVEDPRPTPAVTTEPKTSAMALDEENSKNLNASASAVVKFGTDEEKTQFATGKSSSFNDVAEQIANAPGDPKACADGIVNDSQGKIASKYLPILRKIGAYEADKKHLEELEKQRTLVQARFKSLESRYNLTGGEDYYDAMIVNDLLENPEWEKYKAMLLSNDPSEQDRGYGAVYETLAQAGLFQPYTYMNIERSIKDGKLVGIPEELQKYVDFALNGGVRNDSDATPLTPQEEEYMFAYEDELEKLEKEIADLSWDLEKREYSYKEAVQDKNRLLNDYSVAGEVASKNGAAIDKNLPGDIDTLYNAAREWTPSTWSSSTVYDEAVAEGQYTAEECAQIAQRDIRALKAESESLTRALAAADKYGIKLSDEERKNAEQRLAVINREARSASYFLLDKMPNFSTIAKAAMDKGATDNMSSLTKANVNALITGLFDEDNFLGSILGSSPFQKQFMEHEAYTQEDYISWQGRIAGLISVVSDKEKERYFYLLSTEGEDKANEYFQMLADPMYGSLAVRFSEDLGEKLKAFGEQNGWTAALAYVGSFALNVASNAQSWMTELMHSIEGKEDNPYGAGHMATLATESLRAGTLNALKNAMPNADEEVIDFFFNAITSAGDSTINALLTDGAFELLGEAVPFLQKIAGFAEAASAGEYGGLVKFGANFASDFAHALPMGIGAASKAYRDAIANHATPDQAKALFSATMFAETVSEALTYGNIKSAFQKGAVPDLKGFFKTILSNGGEEAMGEGFNQWWEDNAERTILGETDKYNQMYAYYHDTLGLPASIAEEMVSGEMTKSILLAAASGFVSSMFSSSRAYVQGSISTEVYEDTQKGVAAFDEGLLNYGEDQLVKDVKVLEDADKTNNDTQSAIILSSVLRKGNDADDSNAAAQHMITDIADGSKTTAISTTRGIITAAGTRQTEARSAMALGALTNGDANRVLRELATKAKSGEEITEADVDSLITAAEGDRTGPNKDEIERQYKGAILENRKAARVRDILGTRDVANRIRESEDQAKKARAAAQDAEDEAVAKEDQAEVAKETAQDAIDSLTTEETKDDLGTLEQTLNHADGADNAAKEARERAETQKRVADEAVAKANKAQEDELNAAREQAEVEVQQEEEQKQAEAEAKAQEEFNNAVSTFHPVKTFKSPVTAPVVGGGEVQIIGVYAVNPNATGDTEDHYIYVTTDGYISGTEIAWKKYNGNLTVFDNAGEGWTSQPPVQPKVYLGHSVTGTDNQGNAVTILGVVGKNKGYPVVVDTEGKVYDTYSQIDISKDDIDVVWDAYESVDESALDEISREDARSSQNPDVEMPENFVSYPGGSVTVTANGSRFEVVGIINDPNNPGPLEYVLDDGTTISSMYVEDEPEEFGNWCETVLGEEDEYLPDEPYEPEEDFVVDDYDFEEAPATEDEVAPPEEDEINEYYFTDEDVNEEPFYEGGDTSGFVPQETQTDQTTPEDTYTFGDWNAPYGTKHNVAQPKDGIPGHAQTEEGDDIQIDGLYVGVGNKIFLATNLGAMNIDEISASSITSENVQFFEWMKGVAKTLASPSQGNAASQETVSNFIDKLDSLISNAPKSATPESGFKYSLQTINGIPNKVLVAPVVGTLDGGAQVDGITVDDDGDLAYHFTDGHVDKANYYDLTSKPFLEWALEALDHLPETGSVDSASIAYGKNYLNDQFSHADQEEVAANPDFSQQESEAPDALHSMSQGKTKTLSDGTVIKLYDWQNPSKHGKVRESKAYENPNSKKFKAWQDLDGMTFYDINGNPISKEEGQKYFKGVTYFRGYGATLGHFLYTTHESPAKVDWIGYNGSINFYMDKISTASSYAGTTEISNLRYIDNWETAKAAMRDLGLDLIEAYDPNGSGKPGYLVVKSNGTPAWTKSGNFFTVNQLVKFRDTYGGNPHHKGIHVGYITGSKIMVIDGHWTDPNGNVHGSNYTEVSCGKIKLPNGEWLRDKRGNIIEGTKKTRIWAEALFKNGFDTVVFTGVRDQSQGFGGEEGVEICTSSSEQFKSKFNKGSWSKTKKDILAMKANPKKWAEQRKASKDPTIFKPTGEPLSIGFQNVIKDLRYGKPLEEMSPDERNGLYERLMMLPEVVYSKEHANEDETLSFDATGVIRRFLNGKATIKDVREYVPEETVKLLEDGADYVSVIESLFTPEAVEEQHRVREAMLKRGSFSGRVNGHDTFNGEVARDRRVDVIFGLPASGKSTLANTLSRMFKSRFLDSDVAKELHKDYAGGANSGPLHNESRFIAAQAQAKMIANGDNVVLPLVGHNYDSVRRQLEDFKAAGYDVHFHRVEIPWSEAVARVMNRLAEDGRYLDITYIMNMKGYGPTPAKIADAFDRLYKEGYASGYAVWDNDVPKGELPIATDYSSKAEAALDSGTLSDSESAETAGILDGRGAYAGEAGRYSGLKTTSTKLTPTQKQQKKVKKNLNSPQRIAHDLVRSLGFGNYIGSNNFGNLSRNHRGYWDNHAELVAVKNKDMGDYTVTMHEAGHGLAKKLGLTGSEYMVEQLLREDPSFEDKYAKSELRAEAFAEFVWRYMEDEQRARGFAGDAFYDMFESELLKNPGVNKAVADARSQLQRFIHASLDEKMDSVVRWETTGDRSKARDIIRNVINKMVDTTSIAEDVDAFIGRTTGTRGTLRRTALFAGHAQKRSLVNLTDFLTDANGMIVGDGMAKRMADAGFKGTEENIKLLEKYMLYKHSIRRDELGKPVFDTSITLKDRQAEIKRIERDRPDIKAAAEAWQSFRHDFLQTWMVDTGFWTQELLDKLEKTYPDYVPTFRVRTEDGKKSSLGFSGGKKYTMHRAKGGTEDVYSPYYSFIGMVNQIVEMVSNNNTAAQFDEMYENNEGMGVFARRIPGPVISPAVSMQRQVTELLDGQVDTDVMEKVLDLIKNNSALNSTQEGNNILTVTRKNGQRVQYEIDNPELFRMLSGTSKKQTDIFFRTVGKLVRTMSMLTTGSNPLFAARNAVRDFQNSVNYGSWASNYGMGLAKWLKSFYEVWKGSSPIAQKLGMSSSDYSDYRAMGGGGWTRIDQSDTKSLRDVQEEMFGSDKTSVGKTAKWLGKKLWNTVTLERLNEIIEQTSRFAEYKYGKHDKSTAQGMQEAFQAAQDVTVDFSRHGDSQISDGLKKLVPFFNASLQGVYRTGRQLTEAERGRVGVRLSKTIVNTALASLLSVGLILKFGDDDDKEEFGMLSDQVKSSHLILPNPLKDQPGQPPFLRIPLAQDPLTYAIHGAMTNIAWNGAEDDIAIGLAATADTILDNLNPIGSGTIFQPYIDASHNRTWFGGNLIRTAMMDWVDPTGQYNEDTPMPFRWLGNLFNASPEVVEYLFQQYTGFVGAMAIPALSIEDDGSISGFDAAAKAAIKKWTIDPTSSTDITRNFYDMGSALSTITGEAESNKPQGLLLRSLTPEQTTQAYEEAKEMLAKGGIVYETKKLIKDAYKEIDRINASNMTDSEKDDATRKVRLGMLRSVQAANEQLQAYHKKYVTGETLSDRIFGKIQKRTQFGQYVHVKTDVEKLPDVFQKDVDEAINGSDESANAAYMKRAMSVYNGPEGSGLGGGKSEALPHPSMKYTVTLWNGQKQDVEIPENEQEMYAEIYKKKYEAYIMTSSKGRRWETLKDTEKYDLLKAAARAANDAMKKAYNSKHHIRTKK